MHHPVVYSFWVGGWKFEQWFEAKKTHHRADNIKPEAWMRSREGSLFEEHALGKWQKEVSLWFTRGSDRSRKWFLQKICENKKNKDTALWDLILCTLDEDCLQSVLSGSSHRMIWVYYDWDLEHEISPLLLEILTEKQRAGLQKVFLLHLLFFLSILWLLQSLQH